MSLEYLFLAEENLGSCEEDGRRKAFRPGRAIVVYEPEFELGRISYRDLDLSGDDLHHARTKREARVKARKQIDDAPKSWPDRRKRRDPEALRQYGQWLCRYDIDGTRYAATARDAVVSVYTVKRGVHLAAQILNLNLKKRYRPQSE